MQAATQQRQNVEDESDLRCTYIDETTVRLLSSASVKLNLEDRRGLCHANWVGPPTPSSSWPFFQILIQSGSTLLQSLPAAVVHESTGRERAPPDESLSPSGKLRRRVPLYDTRVHRI